MLNTIFFGNPGAGKSTILNTVIGNVYFPSGVSIGKGLTRRQNSYQVSDALCFTDTPGLADVARLREASVEIQNALNAEPMIKVLFILTLESGYFRTADIATISAVLRSLSKANVDVRNSYGVILNKLTDRSFEAHRSGMLMTSEFFDVYETRFKATDHVLFLKEELDAKDKNNVLLKCKNTLLQFIDTVPPVQLDKPVTFNANSFNDEIEWMFSKGPQESRSDTPTPNPIPGIPHGLGQQQTYQKHQPSQPSSHHEKVANSPNLTVPMKTSSSTMTMTWSSESQEEEEGKKGKSKHKSAKGGSSSHANLFGVIGSLISGWSFVGNSSPSSSEECGENSYSRQPTSNSQMDPNFSHRDSEYCQSFPLQSPPKAVRPRTGQPSNPELQQGATDSDLVTAHAGSSSGKEIATRPKNTATRKNKSTSPSGKRSEVSNNRRTKNEKRNKHQMTDQKQ